MKPITLSHSPDDIRRLAAGIRATAATRPVRIDCGSGCHFGICPKCGRGHGWQVFQANPKHP